MMHILNNLVPALGLLMCLYALMSKRISTLNRINVINMCLFISIYILLLHADFFTEHVPVVSTILGRWLLIAINMGILARSIKPINPNLTTAK